MPASNQPSATPQVQQAVPIAYLPPQAAEEEVSLLDLWCVLLREKWLVFFFTVLCTAGAVAAALHATPIFRAEVLLEPVSADGKQGGGLLAQYGGLAAMAGINIGGGGSSKDFHIATLKSRTFVEGFLRDEKLLPVLFYKKWDSESQSWQVENPKQIPTMWKGVEYFKKNILKVSEDKKTGLITLAIELHDRDKTAQWANLLVERINRHLREAAIQDARKSMEYLKTELANTNIVELKQAIANLLEGQIKKIMLTRVRTDFAFKIIDPAVVPPENRYIKPKKRLMVVLGFMLGGFLGVFAAFFRNFLRNQKETSNPDKP